jgi:hypothetical protein
MAPKILIKQKGSKLLSEQVGHIFIGRENLHIKGSVRNLEVSGRNFWNYRFSWVDPPRAPG